MPVPGSLIIIPTITPFRKGESASSPQVGAYTAFYKTPFFYFPYTSTLTPLTNERERAFCVPRNIPPPICPLQHKRNTNQVGISRRNIAEVNLPRLPVPGSPTIIPFRKGESAAANK